MARHLHRTRRRRAGAALALVAGAVAAVALGGRPAIALGLVAAAAVAALGAALADPGRWERGAAGERSTAAELDRLASRRWRVWHDLRVPYSRANIDHLVVGRTGVWVIDTKTTRAAVTAGWRGVRFGGRRFDPAALRWEAEQVGELLAEETGGPVPVRRLVVVHGSGLRAKGGRAGGVRVLPPEALVARLRRGRRRLRRGERDRVVAAVEVVLARPMAGQGRGRR